MEGISVLAPFFATFNVCVTILFCFRRNKKFSFWMRHTILWNYLFWLFFLFELFFFLSSITLRTRAFRHGLLRIPKRWQAKWKHLFILSITLILLDLLLLLFILIFNIIVHASFFGAILKYVRDFWSNLIIYPFLVFDGILL